MSKEQMIPAEGVIVDKLPNALFRVRLDNTEHEVLAEHNNYYVACGGQSLKLPRTEFLILSRLARSPERIVTAQDLWEYAWGSDKPVNTESLHVYIYRLRNKLTACKLHIDTMVNVGYRLLLESSAGTNLNKSRR